MNVDGQHFRTIWLKPDDEGVVQLIDQRFLPHRFVIEEVRTVEQMATASGPNMRARNNFPGIYRQRVRSRAVRWIT